ncbi:MAG TPA: PBP1A family penicillin-binding protein [Vicinamibacteria bacterium]|nr:PBP1A family penicillin-binding protein [Vicinamibacteria bacterium]
MDTPAASPPEPAATPSASRRGRKLLRVFVVTILFALAAVGGALTGLVLAFQRDLPLIQELENYEPSVITQVLADDGSVIAEFAVEKRVVISYDDVPEHLRLAFVASEDNRFWEHYGVDPLGVARAMWDNLIAGEIVSGASTITQQVSRMLFLTREETVSRKIKEAILAFKIERSYTKREILTFYCNLLHFGHGLYGVEAAAEYYFGKKAKDLTVEESAMLVGIAPAPARYNPFVNSEIARTRRDLVLRRMEEEHFLTPEEYDNAKSLPLEFRKRGPSGNIAPYFVEEVRQYLERKYGATRIYRGGLRVQTTLSRATQEAANRSIDKGLRDLDKRQGWRGPSGNVLRDSDVSIQEYRADDWIEPFTPGQVVTGVVLEQGRKPVIRIGRYAASVDPESASWTGKGLEQALATGDIGQYEVVEVDPDTLTMKVKLDQEPLAEGALLALESRTGQIKAMVGGFDFERSKFNRATQARRQPGSSFKAFAVGAAVEDGYTATSLILDEPVRYVDPSISEAYEPKNYDLKYEGWVTMRRMLEASRNVPAVRLTQQLGPQKVADYARRLGLEGPIPPYLSITLGAAEATLLEMVSAYSAFANQGIRMQPYFITKVTDRDGNVLEEVFPKAASAIRADSAYIITNLLRGVVQRGTAASASRLGRPLAGKTGTTNDYTDAWFIGYDPTLVAGTWMGFDQKVPLGDRETGTRTALTPWIAFMGEVLKDKPIEDFPVPSNIVFVPVDRKTGYPATGEDPGILLEAFIAGTEPTGYPGQ